VESWANVPIIADAEKNIAIKNAVTYKKNYKNELNNLKLLSRTKKSKANRKKNKTI
jgi:hypothetical protein